MFIAMKILIYSSCRKQFGKKGDLPVFSPYLFKPRHGELVKWTSRNSSWYGWLSINNSFNCARFADWIPRDCKDCISPRGQKGCIRLIRLSNSAVLTAQRGGGRSCPLEASATRNIGFSILEHCPVRSTAWNPVENMFFSKHPDSRISISTKQRIFGVGATWRNLQMISFRWVGGWVPGVLWEETVIS